MNNLLTVKFTAMFNIITKTNVFVNDEHKQKTPVISRYFCPLQGMFFVAPRPFPQLFIGMCPELGCKCFF